VGPWGRWTPAFAGVTCASPSFLRKQEFRPSFLRKQESRGPVGPVDPGVRRGDVWRPWGRWTPAFAGVTCYTSTASPPVAATHGLRSSRRSRVVTSRIEKGLST